MPSRFDDVKPGLLQDVGGRHSHQRFVLNDENDSALGRVGPVHGGLPIPVRPPIPVHPTPALKGTPPTLPASTVALSARDGSATGGTERPSDRLSGGRRRNRPLRDL